MESVVLVVALVVVVAVIVSRPFASTGEGEEREDSLRAELEAAKEAKYREIREAELDFRTGKLSDEDHRTTDRELRAQAIAILRGLDELEG